MTNNIKYQNKRFCTNVTCNIKFKLDKCNELCMYMKWVLSTTGSTG